MENQLDEVGHVDSPLPLFLDSSSLLLQPCFSFHHLCDPQVHSDLAFHSKPPSTHVYTPTPNSLASRLIQ